MQRIGAVAIKNTVYVLPATPNALEDFQWAMREIRDSSGEANLFESRVIEGLSDGEVQQLFNAARDADYASILAEAKDLQKAASRKKRDGAQLAAGLQRLRKRADGIATLDFFGAPKGHAVTALLDDIAARLAGTPASERKPPKEAYRGRTWVTRSGVHVDRMASAWLIQRFIDPDATFKFVPARQYRAQDGELRFDMFDAEFTHEGELCTFEVLVQRFGLTDPALRAIAEIVHDIDVKDAKYGREEAPGIGQLVAGIAAAHADDEERLVRGAAVFDDLHALYSSVTKH